MNNEETIDINEIMKIEQMPVVFEQLEKIGALIDERTKDLDKLECTEENKQEVKKRRTEISIISENKNKAQFQDSQKLLMNILMKKEI